MTHRNKAINIEFHGLKLNLKQSLSFQFVEGHFEMDLKISCSLSRALYSEVKESPAASISETPKDAFTLVNSPWHLLLMSQNLSFMSTEKAFPVAWSWLAMSYSKRGWCESVKPNNLVIWDTGLSQEPDLTDLTQTFSACGYATLQKTPKRNHSSH